MDTRRTKEPQYQAQVRFRDAHGMTTLGLATNAAWHDDPIMLLIKLSRYKFVMKMLSGLDRVLDIGCGDAFATRIVLQGVGSLSAIDFDPIRVEDVNDRMEEDWKFDCWVHDIVSGPVEGSFDAAYSLDVIEHIPEADEHRFMSNITQSLCDQGVLILGTPSIQSQIYASEVSKQGHVNCKDHGALKRLMQTYFHNVFIFSMNDEVVHTGYYPMAHYLFALGVGKKPL